MKRWGVLLVLLLVSSGVGAAGDYETVLFTDDLQIDFRMSGWEFSRLKGAEIFIDLKYNVSLVNDAYNRTTVTGFDLLLRNDTHVIDRRALETFTVEQGGWAVGFDTFTVGAQPDAITDMAFRANHTALHFGGQQVNRSVKSRQSFELDVTNQSIRSFTTNATTVYRDDPIFVDANTSNVYELSANGNPLVRGDAGRFYGWIPVSTDLETGNNTVQYVLETARGQRFVRELSYTVVNRAPQFRIEYSKSIPQGEDLAVRVFAVDDTGVANVSVAFRGREQWNTSSPATFTLETGTLPNGTYTYDVAATDVEGAETEDNRSFRIAAPRPDADGDGPDTDYSELTILEGILTFFQGFIDFLLG